jgi:hypothetical protein
LRFSANAWLLRRSLGSVRALHRVEFRFPAAVALQRSHSIAFEPEDNGAAPSIGVPYAIAASITSPSVALEKSAYALRLRRRFRRCKSTGARPAR